MYWVHPYLLHAFSWHYSQWKVRVQRNPALPSPSLLRGLTRGWVRALSRTATASRKNDGGGYKFDSVIGKGYPVRRSEQFQQCFGWKFTELVGGFLPVSKGYRVQPSKFAEAH